MSNVGSFSLGVNYKLTNDHTIALQAWIDEKGSKQNENYQLLKEQNVVDQLTKGNYKTDDYTFGLFYDGKFSDHLTVSSKSIGNIVKGELSFSKRANLLFNNSAFDDEECLSCKVFPICGGGCPIDREKFKNNKEAYCTYYKKYLEELLPYFAKQENYGE